MAECKLKYFDPKAAKVTYGRPYTWLDILIMLRSKLVHVEWVFSGRYGYISWSATTRDGCWCCRFKQIGYSHPLSWRTVIVPMTDEEEDRAWDEACRMADMPINWRAITEMREDGIYYSPNAIKYDILGQGCHISLTLKFWKPTEGKTWCSKACNRLIYTAKGASAVEKLYIARAEMLPDQLYKLAKGYWGRK